MKFEDLILLDNVLGSPAFNVSLAASYLWLTFPAFSWSSLSASLSYSIDLTEINKLRLIGLSCFTLTSKWNSQWNWWSVVRWIVSRSAWAAGSCSPLKPLLCRAPWPRSPSWSCRGTPASGSPRTHTCCWCLPDTASASPPDTRSFQPETFILWSDILTT